MRALFSQKKHLVTLAATEDGDQVKRRLVGNVAPIASGGRRKTCRFFQRLFDPTQTKMEPY